MGAILACCAINLCECAACTACSCFTKVLNWTMSQASRFSHFLIIIITFTLAIILGQSYPTTFDGYTYYTSINLATGCNSDYNDECIYRQLIYRSSAALVILFIILSLVSGISDSINKGFWVMKVCATVGIFIGFWFAQNGFFSGWAQATRIISFFWLLVQGLLLLDFAHDIHEILMESADQEEKKGSNSRFIYVTYIFLSLLALAAAIIGLVFLFKNYTGCGLGLFFVVLTLIVGVITTILSLLDQVQRGLLTPCIMFAYSVFMCWYALLSNPDESCNPTANDVNGLKNGATIVISIISILVLLYCVFNGTKILNIFNPDGEGVVKSYQDSPSKKKELQSVLTGEDKTHKSVSLSNVTTTQPGSPSVNQVGDGSDSSNSSVSVQESGTAHERVFFHVLMILVSSYGAMILTSWGATNGSPEDTNDSSRSQGIESMWLKIVSQWVFLLLYFKVLHAAYLDNANGEADGAISV